MNEALPWFLALVAAPVAWLAPGWLLARMLSAPWPLLSGALASAALGCAFLMAGETVGLPWAGLGGVGAWLALTAGLLWLARNKAPRADPMLPRPQGWEWAGVAAAALAFASLVTRAILDPLSGWDQAFRWDHLARLMVRTGRIAFYPPVSAADFEVYGFPDGIPPLASLANAWIYRIAGATDPVLTLPRVAGEALFAGGACAILARELWGPRGVWPALGLLASSALVGWSVGMGQESGLLAITLTAGCALLLRSARPGETRTAAWAGLAFGLAAWCREYALALGPLAAFVALLQGRRVQAFRCLAVLLAVSLPWYARNWLRTGDPLFPQGLLGPGKSEAYAALLDAIHAFWSRGALGFELKWFAATLPFVAALPLAAGFTGVLRARLRGGAALVAIVGTALAGLWAWSVGYTSGGWNYSLRVLGPALVLAAALGGWPGAVAWRPPARAVLAFLFVLFATDAARRAWWLPARPRTAPSAPLFATWHELAPDPAAEGQLALALHDALPAGDGRVAVERAGLQNRLNAAGRPATTLYSPALAPAFSRTLTAPQAAEALRRERIRWIGWAVGDPVAGRIADRAPLLVTLRTRVAPVLRVGDHLVWDLSALAPAPGQTINAP